MIKVRANPNYQEGYSLAGKTDKQIIIILSADTVSVQHILKTQNRGNSHHTVGMEVKVGWGGAGRQW